MSATHLKSIPSHPTLNLNPSDAALAPAVKNGQSSITNHQSSALTTKSAFLHTLLAAFSFQVAWLIPALAGLTLLYAFFVIKISAHPSARITFRLGFLNGLLVFAPHLAWLWNIFGIAAPCLWSILAFFTAAFVVLIHFYQRRFGTKFMWLAAPILWSGLEYFRSEVYFLKFSWLSVGYAFSEKSGLLPVDSFGVYGTGFIIFLVAGIIVNLRPKKGLYVLSATLVLTTLLANTPPLRIITRPSLPILNIAGIQLEFPPSLEIPKHLDRLLAQYPHAELFVLSEYTFDSAVPQQVRDWCRENQRYLIAGGKDDSVAYNFYNTAFVVGPTGEIIFKQAKSVPIQFFKDGLPAPSQQVWNSPWGKIAIPVCYDLSYRRVMDRFIQAGARAIIVPFMDVTDWGAQQHQLHARIAPLRAREYGIPIFRLGSSGISQHIDATGEVLASLSYPGQEQTLDASLHIPENASLPLDHWLAPFCSILCALFVAFLCLLRSRPGSIGLPFQPSHPQN
jgi:apolipoprotein N-acyltransferase